MAKKHLAWGNGTVLLDPVPQRVEDAVYDGL